jgi:hypothetical protein
MARKQPKTPITVGKWEKVAIRAEDGKWWRFTAKLDTGAEYSRIGASKAAELRLGPIVDVKRIKTSGGARQRRVIVPASVRIAKDQIKVHFSISMRRPGVLIGCRTMRGRFTVDPAKRYLTEPPSLKKNWRK